MTCAKTRISKDGTRFDKNDVMLYVTWYERQQGAETFMYEWWKPTTGNESDAFMVLNANCLRLANVEVEIVCGPPDRGEGSFARRGDARRAAEARQRERKRVYEVSDDVVAAAIDAGEGFT